MPSDFAACKQSLRSMNKCIIYYIFHNFLCQARPYLLLDDCCRDCQMDGSEIFSCRYFTMVLQTHISPGAEIGPLVTAVHIRNLTLSTRLSSRLPGSQTFSDTTRTSAKLCFSKLASFLDIIQQKPCLFISFLQ
jgi:hypothetical protein